MSCASDSDDMYRKDVNGFVYMACSRCVKRVSPKYDPDSPYQCALSCIDCDHTFCKRCADKHYCGACNGESSDE